MSVGSIYNYYRNQGAKLRAYNKAVLDNYDSQVASLGSSLYGTLQSAGAANVNNIANVAVTRIQKEQQAQINAATSALQASLADATASTTSGSSVNLFA